MIYIKFGTNALTATLLCVTLALGACGGGAGSTPLATSGAPSAVYRASAAAPTSSCPTGGIVVNSGIDSNLNGVLDTIEITSTQTVCIA